MYKSLRSFAVDETKVMEADDRDKMLFSSCKII